MNQSCRAEVGERLNEDGDGLATFRMRDGGCGEMCSQVAHPEGPFWEVVVPIPFRCARIGGIKESGIGFGFGSGFPHSE